MSAILDEAVKALNERLGGAGFDGSAKFDIDGEGAIVIDGSGAHISDDDTDVTLSASADTFRAILAGEQNATAAFMMGRLRVAGDMGMAMKLAGILA
jgi:putative sterol carrier protein